MLLLRPLVLVVLASCALAAAPWKLVLKDGRTIVCDAPPVVIDGSYLFRDAYGNDGDLPAGDVDPDKTAAANKTGAAPRWREIGHTEQSLPQADEPAGGGSVLTLGDSNFGAEVLRSHAPVLVDFTATWCGPCRQIAPTVEALASQYGGRVKVGKIDVDRNRATVERYGVHAYPTLLLFKDGAVVGKIVGGAGQSEIARLIDAHL